MLPSNLKVQEIKLHPKQVEFLNTRAKRKTLAGGRGGGKSTVLGYDAADHLMQFPRITNAFVGRTYANLKEVTLNQVASLWEKLGYYENVHYTLFKKPPQKWKWPKPIIAPLDYDHFIPWYNGSGYYLASQDRKTPFRGPSLGRADVDEFANIDYKKFQDQVVPAIRGYDEIFNHHPEIGVINFLGSKPLTSSGKHILQDGNYYVDEDPQFNRKQRQIIELKLEFCKSRDMQIQRFLYDEICRRSQEIKWHVNGKSDDSIFYMEMDGFDNIKALGRKWFNLQYENAESLTHFRVEVLNQTLREVEKGYYPNFSEEKLVEYDTFDYSFLDQQEFVLFRDILPDCRRDGPQFYNRDRSLIISIDWGAKINFMVIAQRWGNKLHILKNVYSKQPELLAQCFTRFLEYYRYHREKHVFFYFGHDGAAKKADNKYTYADQGERQMREAGWNVTRKSSTRYIDPDFKYHEVNKVFRGEHRCGLEVVFNGNNCVELITSIQLTGLKQTPDGVKKDKDPESDDAIPQEEAPHGGDALDNMICGETQVYSDLMHIDTQYQ